MTINLERRETTTYPASLDEAHAEIIRLNSLLDKTIEQQNKDGLVPELLSKKAISEVIERRVEHQEAFGLFLIDLNNFKRFNDTFGHREGDELLKQVGSIFADGFKRETDTVIETGRIGGDEFMVVVDLEQDDTGWSPSYQEQVDKVDEFIRGFESQLLKANQHAHEVGMGLAVGGTYYNPKFPISKQDLLDQADEAMYEEKTPRH